MDKEEYDPDALNEREELFVHLKCRYMDNMPATDIPDTKIWDDVDGMIP